MASIGPEQKNPLLVLALAGVDWPSLSAQIHAGRAPNMAALFQRGAAAPILARPPQDGPAAWATLATGALPEIHGVLGSHEPWAGGVRPISRASWRKPPIWARLEAAGVSTASIGWPAARPGAHQPGLNVDEDFAVASGPTWDDWVLPLNCVPAELREILRPLRAHPSDIDAAALVPLVPDLAELDQSRDAGLPRLAIAMAQASTIQGAAAWMMAEAPRQAVFLHQPWLAQVRAAFGQATQGPFARAVDGAWRFLDGMVGHLVRLAGPDASVVIASPGWKSSAGLFLAAGPGIEAGARPDPIELHDVASTCLALAGLRAPDLTGRIVAVPREPTAVAPEPPPLSPSEVDVELLKVAMEHGFHPPAAVADSWHAGRLTYLAHLLLPRAPAAARSAAEAALLRDPENAAALSLKAMACVALGDVEDLPRIGDVLLRAAPQAGWGALAHGAYYVLTQRPADAGAHLARAEQDPDPETRLRVAAAWLAAHRAHEAERVFRSVLQADQSSVAARLGLAICAVLRRDFITAEPLLTAALRLDPGHLQSWLELARLYAATGRTSEAARAAGVAARLGAPDAEVQAARTGQMPD